MELRKWAQLIDTSMSILPPKVQHPRKFDKTSTMTHLTPNGKASFGSGIAFTALASIAVGLRILSKTYTKVSWSADDSWAVLGLVAFYAMIAAEFWGMSYLYCEAIPDLEKQPLTKAGLYAGGGGLNVETILMRHESGIFENYLKASPFTGKVNLRLLTASYSPFTCSIRYMPSPLQRPN